MATPLPNAGTLVGPKRALGHAVAKSPPPWWRAFAAKYMQTLNPVQCFTVHEPLCLHLLILIEL